jgi:16S rRNA (cytosine1402-N4)-methyltransferase
MPDRFGHIPVLMDEVLGVLHPKPGEIYIDCTAGLGGHAAAVGAILGSAGRVVLNDLDAGNLQRATAAVGATGVSVTQIHGNFADLPWALPERGVAADMVLADLGFASSQVDDAERGLSFMRDGPLDMRLDPSKGLTAADLVNRAPESELARTIAELGEEKQAAKIARKIVQARQETPIQSTSQLAEVVKAAVPWNPEHVRIHPATRTFQALRIAVNDELGSLDAFLAGLDAAIRGQQSGQSWLAKGARIAIISFHSLEDRRVKEAFAGFVKSGLAMDEHGLIRATEAEQSANPRSRSAKMRVVTLVGKMKV